MSDLTKKQANFRPDSYWDWETPTGRIKGQERRRLVRETMVTGSADDICAIPDDVLEESLSDDTLTAVGRLHPKYMGGEYLPDAEPGDVEIARVCLRSTTYDVISIRARPRDGRIEYDVTDEYETGYRFSPTHSDRPLTMGELVGLIDGARMNMDQEDQDAQATEDGTDWEKMCGLTVRSIAMTVEPGDSLYDMDAYVDVESDFYPDLDDHYSGKISHWIYVQEKRREGGECPHQLAG